MDHVRQIQEIVDEHKEELPTGVVVDVMEECQKAYNAIPNLWKIHYVEIDAVGKNKAWTEEKTAIFEEIDDESWCPKTWFVVFKRQKMPSENHFISVPAFHDGDGRVIVVTSYEKWGKRARNQ